MKPATIQEIKQALTGLKPAELTALCLRLARLKKDNKELLTYLLFEAGDEAGYVQSVKNEMDELFAGINTASAYFVKKSLRKVVRLVNRCAGFSSSAQTEAELRIHFCILCREYRFDAFRSKMLDNIYDGQLKKIRAVISTLHEDLQYDYEKQVKGL